MTFVLLEGKLATLINCRSASFSKSLAQILMGCAVSLITLFIEAPLFCVNPCSVCHALINSLVIYIFYKHRYQDFLTNFYEINYIQ